MDLTRFEDYLAEEISQTGYTYDPISMIRHLDDIHLDGMDEEQIAILIHFLMAEIKYALQRVIIPPNTAIPPREIAEILVDNGLDPSQIPWYSKPIIPYNEIPQKKGIRKINAFELLNPLIGNKALKGTIRTMDLANGCKVQCDTCLADAQIPSSLFDDDSLEQLFSTPNFLQMLHIISLRIGHAGDLLDHPNAIEILKMILEKTLPLNKECILAHGRSHKIKLYTNYRKHREKQLDRLLTFACQNPDRLYLNISLPRNKTQRVQHDFSKYTADRENIFGEALAKGDKHGFPLRRNIVIFDVNTEVDYFHPIGRVLHNDDIGMPDTTLNHRLIERGHVKTILNPDALWLHCYGTMKESPTCRVYTPITPTNIEVLKWLPWNTFFYEDPMGASKPPHWQGCVPYGIPEATAVTLKKIVYNAFSSTNFSLNVVT